MTIDRYKATTAARSLFGPRPPVWLTEGLINGLSWSANAHRGYLSLPKKEKQLEELDRVVSASRKLIAAIGAEQTEMFIAQADNTLFFANESFSELREIERRAGIAALALRAQPDKLRAWPLRQGDVSKNTLVGQLLCAITVVEAWRVVWGEQPKPGNEKAQLVCSELWDAASLPSLGKAENNTPWRSHLVSAIKINSKEQNSALGSVTRDIAQAFKGRASDALS